MNNFVPLLRSDRLREIIEYAKRGYIFRLGENNYKYVREITVSNENNVIYSFEVRVTQDEPRFYIVSKVRESKESCVYLTIYELYLYLKEIAKILTFNDLKDIILSKRGTKYIIEYTGLKFQLNFFDAIIPSKTLKIADSNIDITYDNFFVLIALVQDKSNYYWSLSSAENKEKYTDGILRLLLALVCTKGNEILESHKWFYNEQKKIYDKPKDNHEFKYYLTQNEFDTIMEVKS